MADGWYGIGEAARDSFPPSIKPLTQLRLSTQRVGDREVVVAGRGVELFVLGEKMPSPPVHAAWKRRLGKYHINNSDPGFPVVDVALKLRHGKLCMSYRMPRWLPNVFQVPLSAVSDTEAVV